MQPHDFPEDPVEQLRNNVWIAPYYEDDLPELAEVIGVDKILFGSDWPHGEGLEIAGVVHRGARRNSASRTFERSCATTHWISSVVKVGSVG